ncbi:ABC transporter permease [Paracoccus sp. CPCC 101403]|uniref:Transport permease protein n=2 Tax=Paracoccus broussonetiae TaxID=3075834 RepID=A0ABU3EA68_9RHOB|nr:ABC transporter permease [Paracoccus sp. CPCC 101403]MDT1060365.1 ABC transporter permease [Paracoccus sp. CPCC 101403]
MPRILTALILREMTTTYGRSAGGYAWAILDPVLGIVLLSVIFSMFLAKPGLGSNFPLFYATGFLPFAMFSDLTNKVASSIRYSRPFLAYPSVTFIDAILARIILNTLTHMTVITIVIGGIFVLYRMPIVVNLAEFFEGMLMIVAISVGVGTLNCYLLTTFPVWERVWQIITRPLFLASGVFFLYDKMPYEAQHILWFNPILHCIAQLRRGVYPVYDAEFVSPFYVFGISIVLLLFGLLLLERNHRDMLER